MEPTTCVWRIIGQEDIMGTLGNVVKLEDRELLRVETQRKSAGAEEEMGSWCLMP